MNIECFDKILALISEDIKKQHTLLREPIEPDERLAVTLRFLITGESYKSLADSFLIGSTTISQIVVEVCEALWNRLQPIYMPEPTQDIWEKSISGFNETWQFPNCLGTIISKHVIIKKQNEVSLYCTYLKKYSIIMTGIIGPNLEFISIDVGYDWKNKDGGIFQTSSMGMKIENENFNIPPDKSLPGMDEKIPCVFIAGDSITLCPYIMKAFPQRQSKYDTIKQKYNSHLCRTLGVVESAFGIFTNKWRLFFKPLEVKAQTSITIVKAACVLHNFLRVKSCDSKFQHLIEVDDRTVQGLHNFPIDGKRASRKAMNLREIFVDFVNNI